MVEYLKTPPSRERLLQLLAQMGVAPRGFLQRSSMDGNGSYCQTPTNLR